MDPRINKRVQDAVAAAYKDKLSRNYNWHRREQLHRLGSKHHDLIMASNPESVADGDYVAVLTNVYKAYIEAWQLAREEYKPCHNHSSV